MPPASETTGACSKQLRSQLNKRNCRYGKCEQTNEGKNYTCHCDEVSLLFNFKQAQRFFLLIILLLTKSLSRVESVTAAQTTPRTHARRIRAGARQRVWQSTRSTEASSAFVLRLDVANIAKSSSWVRLCWFWTTLLGWSPIRQIQKTIPYKHWHLVRSSRQSLESNTPAAFSTLTLSLRLTIQRPLYSSSSPNHQRTRTERPSSLLYLYRTILSNHATMTRVNWESV